MPNDSPRPEERPTGPWRTLAACALIVTVVALAVLWTEAAAPLALGIAAADLVHRFLGGRRPEQPDREAP
ncbi:hypothetical protein LO762_15900 [Actinocorallia sp. API 0066]|uniref:hypothetical protein n=1 Tax=Actinocorallia sp. API 0066 TaxID=2896846 RepID=UPI001E5C54C0|nr:hypothetical protein [Actinocorallia sp. API 0066]MCD0450661.1 hypothetical protein [Actinocorallia sp. API 0066]